MVISCLQISFDGGCMLFYCGFVFLWWIPLNWNYLIVHRWRGRKLHMQVCLTLQRRLTDPWYTLAVEEWLQTPYTCIFVANFPPHLTQCINNVWISLWCILRSRVNYVARKCSSDKIKILNRSIKVILNDRCQDVGFIEPT